MFLSETRNAREEKETTMARNGNEKITSIHLLFVKKVSAFSDRADTAL